MTVKRTVLISVAAILILISGCLIWIGIDEVDDQMVAWDDAGWDVVKYDGAVYYVDRGVGWDYNESMLFKPVLNWNLDNMNEKNLTALIQLFPDNITGPELGFSLTIIYMAMKVAYLDSIREDLVDPTGAEYSVYDLPDCDFSAEEYLRVEKVDGYSIITGFDDGYPLDKGDWPDDYNLEIRGTEVWLTSDQTHVEFLSLRLNAPRGIAFFIILAVMFIFALVLLIAIDYFDTWRLNRKKRNERKKEA